MATTNNKKTFIDILCSMTHNEINDYIKQNGKKPKKVFMVVNANKNKK